MNHFAPKGVIYARISSSLQSETSIDAQIDACTKQAESMGVPIARIYKDVKISGASAINRPGFQDLRQGCKDGKFTHVFIMTLDRLGRRLADVADLYDHISYNNIQVYSPSIGLVTEIHIAIYGNMAQTQLKLISYASREGQKAAIREGRVAGGKSYAYDVLPPKFLGRRMIRGFREINHDQAKVVKRIFQMYADGKSPAEIALILNNEGVPGPTGGLWRDSTIRGNRKKGDGIINNQSYIGVVVYNRRCFPKNPETGKRTPRYNPPEEILYWDFSDLRIIDDDLWAKVKDEQEKRTRNSSPKRDVNSSRPGTDNNLNANHRTKYLLSGLLTCSECGGAYTLYGKHHYRCSNYKKGTHTCQNGKSIKRDYIEARVLKGLKNKLINPNLVKSFIKETEFQLKTLFDQNNQEKPHLEKKLKEITKGIEGILAALEQRSTSPSLLDRLDELEQDKIKVEEELSKYEDSEPDFSALYNLEEAYADLIRNLEDILNDEDIKTSAIQIVQGLIEKVVLTPNPEAENGLEAMIHGDLARILRSSSNEELPASFLEAGSQLSVVAGVGFEPTTFRL